MTYSAHGLKVGGGLVLEVGGVGDLARSPDALVGGVVDVWRGPLALVVGVPHHGLRPRATARHIGTLRVGDGGRNPVTILLVIPVLGFLSLGVRNREGLVNKPILGLLSLLINDLEGSILVPIIRLGGIGVGDSGFINPVLGLRILGVVNFLGRVDGRVEVLEEAPSLDLVVVLLDDIRVVRVNNESVKLSSLDDPRGGGRNEVLLLILARLGVLVVEDEVDLVGVAALVGTKHDDVGSGIGELLTVKVLVFPEELQVGTAALEAVL